jgi:hypothetical protein
MSAVCMSYCKSRKLWACSADQKTCIGQTDVSWSLRIWLIAGEQLRKSFDILWIPMQPCDEKIFSHQDSGFPCICIGLSASEILSAPLVDFWDLCCQDSVAYSRRGCRSGRYRTGWLLTPADQRMGRVWYLYSRWDSKTHEQLRTQRISVGLSPGVWGLGELDFVAHQRISYFFLAIWWFWWKFHATARVSIET